MDENGLVAWLRRTLPGGDLIGDDAAIIDAGDTSWAVTVDQQIAGVHVPIDVDPAIAARRLLAVNLSDLAAMGAQPSVAFLALGAPDGFDHPRFFRALARAANRQGVRIAGGDLARQPRFAASLTMLGPRWPEGRWLRRAGAVPGHTLWVGGPLGDAALGLALLDRGARLDGRRVDLPDLGTNRTSVLRAARRAVRRQLTPRPQVDLGRYLATEATAGAAMDVSDGLARDLHRLCRASGVGAVVHAESLPTGPGAVTLSRRLDINLTDRQLFGGEDYVLLFTLPDDHDVPPDWSCHAIGTVQEGSQVTIRKDGSQHPLPDRGWDHIADAS